MRFTGSWRVLCGRQDFESPGVLGFLLGLGSQVRVERSKVRAWELKLKLQIREGFVRVYKVWF